MSFFSSRQFFARLIKIASVFVIFFSFWHHKEDLTPIIFDAYNAVGIFVTATLLVIYFFEHYTANGIRSFLIKHEKLQVPISTFLGVIPGCGGAIVVVTQYSKGFVTFGSMVATLIATMGDAAILLIQKKPQMALILFVIVSVVAIITGYMVDFLSKEKFLPKNLNPKQPRPTQSNKIPKVAEITWFIFFTIGIFLYFFPSIFTESFKKNIGHISILLCIVVWVFKSPSHACEDKLCTACTHIFGRVAIEASFIIAWVFIGMALFQGVILFFDINLASFINANKYYVPLVAMLLGLIPGCGPQIILTTMYISGLVPFSAQVTNAISNDGDAIMPALVMQPRKVLMATVYGILPALIVGYTMLFMGY